MSQLKDTVPMKTETKLWGYRLLPTSKEHKGNKNVLQLKNFKAHKGCLEKLRQKEREKNYLRKSKPLASAAQVEILSKNSKN